MAATGHKQPSDRIEFCRAPNCKQDDYRGVCKVDWKFEAHHILCVAQVGKAIVTDKPDLEKIINESEWCINSTVNMIALPIWGSTVLHYSHDFSSIGKGDFTGLMKNLANVISTKTTEPPFKDWPQHNYQHSGSDQTTSYNKELEFKLKSLFQQIEILMKTHAVTGAQVNTALDNLAKKMRQALFDRGHRLGSANGIIGTHNAWLYPGPTWYEPFSMAQVAKPIPYPKNASDSTSQKIRRLAEASWG